MKPVKGLSQCVSNILTQSPETMERGSPCGCENGGSRQGGAWTEGKYKRFSPFLPSPRLKASHTRSDSKCSHIGRGILQYAYTDFLIDSSRCSGTHPPIPYLYLRTKKIWFGWWSWCPSLKGCSIFVNTVSKFDAYSVPHVDEMLNWLSMAFFCVTLDSTKEYWPFPLCLGYTNLSPFC